MIKTILAITVVVLSIAVFSVLFAPKKEYKQDRTTRSASIKIINLTEEKSLSAVLQKGIQVLKIKNILVVIVNLSKEEMEEDDTLMGFITDKETYFLVKLRPGLSEDYYLEIICHELTHLKQLYNKDLKILYYGFSYKGFTYTFNYPYWDRLWEIEAFDNEEYLKLQIINYPHCLN